jgi:hypothetical protein
MSKYGNRVAKLSGLAVLALFTMGTTQAGALAIWNGITPASNDSTSWGLLGADGATIPSPFHATSSDVIAITGSFAGGSGLVALQCPALPSCSWTGGFPAGDHLVWTLSIPRRVAPLKASTCAVNAPGASAWISQTAGEHSRPKAECQRSGTAVCYVVETGEHRQLPV